MAKKCNMLKGKFCGGVEEIFQFGDPEGDGLHVANVVNVKDYAKGHGLLYRKRKQFKGHIWLNFCPFCGADVQERTK